MSGRARKRVEEEAAAEEAWTLDNYTWDPVQCVARKRTKMTQGDSAQAVFGTQSYLEGSSEAAMLAAGSQLLQQQLAAVPCIEPLPELQTVNPEECDPATHCEVTGCGLCLEGLKRYYIRMRVCEKHLHAPAVLVNGTISRFCQQCGKWQAVTEFEGSKKSCIATLERHNARHRAKVQARLAEQHARGGSAAEKAAAKAAAKAATAAAGAAKRRSGSAAPKGRAAPSNSGASDGSGGSAAGNSDNARSSFGMAELMGTAASAFVAGGPMPYPPAMDGGGGMGGHVAPALLQPSFGAWDAAGGASGAAAAGSNGANSGGGLALRPPITTGLAAAAAASAVNGMSLAGSGRLGSVEVTGGFARLPSAPPPPQQQEQPQQPQQLLLPMLLSQEGMELDRALQGLPPHDAFRRASSMNMSQPLQRLQPPPPPEDVRMALGAVKAELLSQQPPPPQQQQQAGGYAPLPEAWRQQGYPMGGPAAGPYENNGMRGFGGGGGYAPSYPARTGSGMPSGPVFGGLQHAPHGYSQPYDGHGMPGHMQYGGYQPPQPAAGYHPQHHYQLQQHPQAQQPGYSQFPAQQQQQQQMAYAAAQQQQHLYSQPMHYQHQYQQAPTDAGFAPTPGSRDSTPSAGTGGFAPDGGAAGAAAGATPHASSGSDTSGIQSQATARQAMAAAVTAAAAAAAASDGVPQPRGSSGTAASGASGSAFANSNGGGGAAATAAAAAGGAAANAGAGGVSDSGALAARLNNVMAELSTLVAQVAHLQQPASGGSPSPPALTPPAAGQALAVRNDSAPADMPLPLRLPAAAGGAADAAAAAAAAAAAGHSPRSVSAQSAPTRPGSDAVTSSARAGSSSLSPIMDAALNMMAQVSELAAALQPGSEPAAAARPPQPGFQVSPWAVTTGMPAALQGQPQQQALQQPGGGSGGWGSHLYPQQQQQPVEMAASSSATKPSPTEGFAASGPGFVVSTGYPGSSGGNGSGGGAAPAGSANQPYAWVPPPAVPVLYTSNGSTGQQQQPLQAAAAAHMHAHTPYSAGSHADSPSTTVDDSAAPSPMHPPAPHHAGGGAADAKPGDANAAAAAAFGPDADGDDLDEQLLGELFEYLEEENGPANATAANCNGNGHATVAVAAQQAVGNYQQTMAAQPYPLPAASLAPPPAASGAAASPPIVEDDVDEREFTRVSLKAMNVLPHELPPNLRASLRRWLRESRAEALQATLRPGCLQLVVDVARPLRTPAGARVPGDLASVLIPPHDADQAAADVFRILGQRLRDTYVQVDRQVLQIRVGERPIVLSWEQAAEDGGLDNARFPELFTCSVPAVCAGAEVSLELTGKHLCHPSTKAFARLRGHDLQAARLPNPMPSPASAADPSTSNPEAEAEAAAAAGPSRDPATSSGSLLRVRVQLPAGAVGLMVVEAAVGHLLGGWWPVLVLPAGRDAAAAELGELSAQAQEAARAEALAAAEAPAPASGGAAKRGFERLVRDLASVLETHADVCASASPSSSAPAAAAATTSTSSPPETATGASSTGSPHAAAAASGPDASQRSGSTRTCTRSSGDGTVDASTTAASAAGWSMYTADTLTGTTGAGSTMASTLLTTTTTTGPRGAAPHHGGAHAAGAAGAGGSPGAGAAAAGAPGRHSSPTHSGDGAAVAPARVAPVAEPTADAVRKALSRCARLLRYTIARGRPHLTALLLEAAHGLAAFPGALPAAAAAQPASAFVAASIDLQALLPLAVLSGSVATVDVMVGFAAAVLRAPLRLDLPHGPAGLSALHLSALLRDGGAMAGHLVSSQPWAAWSWMCLGWQPPNEEAAPAAAASAAAAASRGAAAESTPEKAEEDNAEAEVDEKEAEDEAEEPEEEEEEEAEEEDLRAPVPLPTRLTPGALCVLLGQTAPLQRAVALVQAAQQRRVAAGAAGAPPAEGDVAAALVGAVQAWGRTGAALLSALCEQLARQRL